MPSETVEDRTIARLHVNKALGRLVSRFDPELVLDQIKAWVKFMDDCREIGRLMEAEGTDKTVPIAMHEHGTGGCRSYRHAHAWPEVPHSHILRAICQRPECEGCATHNIHEGGSLAERKESE